MVYWGEDQEPWTVSEPQILSPELLLIYLHIFLPHTLRNPLAATTKISGTQNFYFSRSQSLLKGLQLKITAPSPPHRPSSCLSVKSTMWLTTQVQRVPNPARAPRSQPLGTSANRTQMFMKRASRESSFQCAVSARFPPLFNYIATSFVFHWHPVALS